MSAYRSMLVTKIAANPDQPRKHFDETKLQELADSIAANGLLEPVIVRPVGDTFLLIAGERRWRAAQRAGLARIPARIMEGLSDADAFALSAVENINRDDMTVMEEVRSFARLVEYGKTIEEVAALFGKRPMDIRDRLILVNLDPATIEHVEAGLIGPSLAYYLARVLPGNRPAVVNRVLRGELSQSEACDLVQAIERAEGDVGFFDIEEPTTVQREEHRKVARATSAKIDSAVRALALLEELAKTDPAELADALGADIGARVMVLADLTKSAKRAHATMTKAQAIAAARELIISEGARA